MFRRRLQARCGCPRRSRSSRRPKKYQDPAELLAITVCVPNELSAQACVSRMVYVSSMVEEPGEALGGKGGISGADSLDGVVDYGVIAGGSMVMLEQIVHEVYLPLVQQSRATSRSTRQGHRGDAGRNGVRRQHAKVRLAAPARDPADDGRRAPHDPQPDDRRGRGRRQGGRQRDRRRRARDGARGVDAQHRRTRSRRSSPSSRAARARSPRSSTGARARRRSRRSTSSSTRPTRGA